MRLGMVSVDLQPGRRDEMRRVTFAIAWKTIILFAFLSACATGPKTAIDSSAAGQMTSAAADPTLTPSVDYTNQSEIELAALIVENAGRLDAAVESFIAATGDVASDDDLTEDVKQELLDLLQIVHAAQSELEQAFQVYSNRYAALSPEASNQTMAFEVKVEDAIDSIDDLDAKIKSDGMIDLEAFDRLDEAWTASGIEPNIMSWHDALLREIDRRETYYMNIQPQSGQVADNRVEAFIQAHDFVQAFQEALEDEIFTPAELARISQIGANAEASLYNTGDPQLFGYAQSIDDLTRNAVRGEWPLASSGINDLRLSLPARPQP